MNNKGLKYLLLVLFLFFVYFFTKWYVTSETPLYICDLCEQNLNLHDYSIMLKEDVSEFFKALRYDVYMHNRNVSLTILLLPFAYIIKDFRFGFIFASEMVYLLPVMILMLNLFNKYFIQKAEISILEFLMILSSIFLAVNLWQPVISGIPDTCGMVPVLICFFMYFKYGFNKKTPAAVILLTGVLLYCSFLFRRWYSIVILSFCISVIIENIAASLKTENRIKQYLFTLFHLGIFAGIFYALAYFIQGGYFKEIIRTEMQERALYIADYNQLWAASSNTFGFFITGIALFGLIFCFKNRLVRFCALNMFIFLFTFIVVMNNQFLWINHLTYPAVCTIILFCAGAHKIIELIKNEKLKSIFAVLIILFNIYNFSTFFVIDKPEFLNGIMPSAQAHPEKNPDYDQILELYHYLENEYNKNNSIKIAMYGLNNSLGWWQFRCLNPDSSFVKETFGFEHVLDEDLEGETYDEDFVLLVNPSITFSESSNYVKINEIYSMFETNTGIAQNYTKIKEFNLSDNENTSVTLYKRK